MSVLDNRLNVTVDYYNRRTKDLLYTYTVPVPPNLYPSKFANVGTIDNKGIEVTVNATPISRKNFSWNLAATISHNKNNLVKFSNEDYEMVQIQTGYFPDDLKMYTMRIVEGGSLGNFWGPKFLGFNDNGGAIYEDLDGVEGITEADYQVIGNAYPDVLLSLQNTFSYKQWSLSFLLRSSIGNDVLNQSRVYYEGFGYFGTRNILRSTLDHANYKDGAYYSSRFVEDGSYLKLDNITLSYDFKLKSKVIPSCAAMSRHKTSLPSPATRESTPKSAFRGCNPASTGMTSIPARVHSFSEPPSHSKSSDQQTNLL